MRQHASSLTPCARSHMRSHAHAPMCMLTLTCACRYWLEAVVRCSSCNVHECTDGAQSVHSQCTVGAQSVLSRCTSGALLWHSFSTVGTHECTVCIPWAFNGCAVMQCAVSRAPGGPVGRWDRIPVPEFARIQIPATGNVPADPPGSGAKHMDSSADPSVQTVRKHRQNTMQKHHG